MPAGQSVTTISTGRTLFPGIFLPEIFCAEFAGHTGDYRKKFANPFIAASRGYIDDVIAPHATRKRICRSLAMLREKRLDNPWRKHDNIPL